MSEEMTWRPIETAPDLDRVLVAGWQPRNQTTRGYWWWNEDVTCDGKAIESPEAILWHPIVFADFPAPPALATASKEGGE